MKYVQLARKNEQKASRTLAFFVLVVASNTALGVWALMLCIDSNPSVVCIACHNFDLFIPALTLCRLCQSSQAIGDDEGTGCVQRLRKCLFAVGILCLVSALLAVWTCFGATFVLDFHMQVAGHFSREEAHFQNAERHREATGRGSAEFGGWRPSSHSRDGQSDDDDPSSSEPSSSEATDEYEEKDVVGRRLTDHSTGPLRAESIQSLTDNAFISCCSTCLFTCAEVAKTVCALMALEALATTNCSDGDHTGATKGRRLVAKATIFTGVYLGVLLVTLFLYIYSIYLCVSVVEVLQRQHELLKFIQNRFVRAFWVNERREQRRKVIQRRFLQSGGYPVRRDRYE